MSERCEEMSERCERTSKWTSEWPSTLVWGFVWSGPQWKGELSVNKLTVIPRVTNPAIMLHHLFSVRNFSEVFFRILKNVSRVIDGHFPFYQSERHLFLTKVLLGNFYSWRNVSSDGWTVISRRPNPSITFSRYKKLRWKFSSNEGRVRRQHVDGHSLCYHPNHHLVLGKSYFLTWNGDLLSRKLNLNQKTFISHSSK